MKDLLSCVNRMKVERQVIDTELFRSVDTLARCFVQRWDLHARQVNDGRYICIQKPLTREYLFAHLNGEITLGTYVLSKKNLARFIIFDDDDEDGFNRLAHLAMKIAKNQIPSYLEGSRRGGHLWLFFSEAIQGKEARLFGKALLSKYKVKDVELFPKQDKLVSGPGSLIRMPFGIHKLSGQRYDFFNLDGSPLASTLGEQIQILSAPVTVSEEVFKSSKVRVVKETISSLQMTW